MPKRATKKLNFYLPLKQYQRLCALSGREGRSIAELLRMGVDMVLASKLLDDAAYERVMSTPPRGEESQAADDVE